MSKSVDGPWGCGCQGRGKGGYQLVSLFNNNTTSTQLIYYRLVKILQNKRGDPLTDEEIEAMYKGKPPIDMGVVDYKAFAKVCHGR